MEKVHRLDETSDHRRGYDHEPVAPGRSTVTSRHVMRAPEALDRAAATSGAPLPDELRGRFETSLGADLSAVRVHTGAASGHAAASVGARAYATGPAIHFADGQYDPSSERGQFLIAHEVAHTVQQAGVAPTVQHKLEVSTSTDAHEREADVAAQAMVDGRRASVTTGAAPIIHRKADPVTNVIAPEEKDGWIQEHENVQTDGKQVTWERHVYTGTGTDVEQKSGLDMYGPDARAQGIHADPADPFGMDPLSANWDIALSGPPDPPAWGCSYALKQPLPVWGPDRDPLTGDTKDPVTGAPKPEVAWPVNESQIAFAQSCIDAFAPIYPQVETAWYTMAPLVADYNAAGADPMFHEGGLNWLPNTQPTEAQKTMTLDQVASQQTVGDGTRTVDDVVNMPRDQSDYLKSELGADKQTMLEKEAGKPAAANTLCQTVADEVATLERDKKNLRHKLDTASKAVSLGKLEEAQNDEKDKLADAQSKQKQLDTAVKIATGVLDAAVSFATYSKAADGVKGAWSLIKTGMVELASHASDDQLKQHATRIKELAGEMKKISSEIKTEQVEQAAEDILIASDKIIEAKKRLVVAIKAAEDAHEAFAKKVGDTVGGPRGQDARASIEALPKIAMVAGKAQAIAAAITVPGFSERAGVGMFGAASPPETFRVRAGMLKGYQLTFTEKAKQWEEARARCESIAASYGLGN